jgi:L-2-hydroxycarboxylate dehydrogenase (NAD+)
LESLLRSGGCDDANASVIADGFLEAELTGYHTQGVEHMEKTLEELSQGRLHGKARPRIISENGSVALTDGDRGHGHVSGRFAAGTAVALAKNHGAAIVGLRNCNDLYRLGYYGLFIAEARMSGIILSNAYPARMHPFGGMDPLIGTNPMCFSFPAAESKPMVIDFSTSTWSPGRVRWAGFSGESLPENIAIDHQGSPVTDPQEAMRGALSPLAGHKGFGLSLALAVLSGPLIGAAVGQELDEAMRRTDGIGHRGHLFMAIDPASFGDSHLCRNRIENYLEEIRNSRLAPGSKEILVPGDGSRRKREKALAEGVELPGAIWDRLMLLASHYGLTTRP